MFINHTVCTCSGAISHSLLLPLRRTDKANGTKGELLENGSPVGKGGGGSSESKSASSKKGGGGKKSTFRLEKVPFTAADIRAEFAKADVDGSGTLSYTELFDLLVKSGVSRTSAELWAKNFFTACGITLTQEEIDGYTYEDEDEGEGEEHAEDVGGGEEGDEGGEEGDEGGEEGDEGVEEDVHGEEDGEDEGDAVECEGAAEEDNSNREISFSAFMAEYARMQTLRVVTAFQKQVCVHFNVLATVAFARLRTWSLFY